MLVKQPIEDIYTEAKAYALKGALLDRNFIDSLASLSSVREIAERLASTPYAEVIRGPEGVDSSRKLEGMLRAALALDYYELSKWFRRAEVLKAYLGRLLGWNLKMVLRAKHQGKSFEEIMDVLYLKAEEILGRREVLVKILASSTIEEGIELLKGDPFYEPLKKALEVYKEKRDPVIFDLYIDRTVYTEIRNSVVRKRRVGRKQVDKNFMEFVELDLLKYNLSTILRAKLLGLPTSEIRELIVGLDEVDELIKLLEARSVEEIGRCLKKLGFDRAASAGSIESMLQAVEEELKAREVALARSAFYKRVMTPTVVLAYLKLKEVEVENLIKVALGIELGLPKDRIFSSLI